MIVQRVSLHREHLQAAKIVVEKIIMRDKMFVLSCDKRLSVCLLLTLLFIYCYRVKIRGAVVMAEIKIVMASVKEWVQS